MIPGGATNDHAHNSCLFWGRWWGCVLMCLCPGEQTVSFLWPTEAKQGWEDCHVPRAACNLKWMWRLGMPYATGQCRADQTGHICVRYYIFTSTYSWCAMLQPLSAFRRAWRKAGAFAAIASMPLSEPHHWSEKLCWRKKFLFHFSINLHFLLCLWFCLAVKGKTWREI